MPNDNDQTLPKATSDATEISALQAVIAVLSPLTNEARRRILNYVANYLGVDYRQSDRAPPPVLSTSRSPAPSFSEDTSMPVKDFLLEKDPQTNVERIACLAYYLTHYRGTPHFKTIDLTMLNMEAAQPKFPNATMASNDGVKLGYLVPSTKGARQLSAAGERFVRALPDRALAKAALEAVRRRYRARRAKAGGTSEDQ